MQRTPDPTERAMHQASGPDATTKPRVLVPVTIDFAFRALIHTGLVRRLTASCTPVLAMSWHDEATAAGLRRQGFEVVQLPTPEVGQAVWDAQARSNAAFIRRLRSPSIEIDHRRRDAHHPWPARAHRWLARRRDAAVAALPGADRRAASAVDDAMRSNANLDAYAELFAATHVDAMFSITPYAVQETVLLHAARRAGLAATTSILSFDNLTTRPPLPVPFVRYAVWNRHMAGELLRCYPDLVPEQIDVVGPAQFDVYFDDRFAPDADAWRARVGVAANTPTVLFGGGPTTIAPNEPQFLDHLLEGIADGRLPAELRIVLRPHPHDDPDRWQRFRSHPAVAFDDASASHPMATGHPASRRAGDAGYEEHQIVALRGALELTDVHVNVSSTMTLDGALFDKPQIGPAYDRTGTRRHDRLMRDLYRREHFAAIVASGGLELARSPEALVALVAAALRDPGRLASQRHRMLTEVGAVLDGRAAERIATSVERALRDAGLLAS